MKKIMLLGSGELGKEVIISAQRLGCHVVAVDRYINAPGMQVADQSEVINMLEEQELLDCVTKYKPDIIVPEIEAIRTEVLLELEKTNTTIIPTAKATNLTMNRDRIRDLVKSLGIRTANYSYAESLDEFKNIVNTIGIPCVVKPVMSSSGKGQSTVHSNEDIEPSWKYALSGARGDRVRVIVEEFIKFDYEITLLTVKQNQGPTVYCPPIGHFQERGDYQYSWQPQKMSEKALDGAKLIAKTVTDNLGGKGIFGVEFFIKDDEVIFSELSPRPHDTGMVTLISQDYSEFALHVRAILGLPIPNIRQLGPSASCAIVIEGQSNDIRFKKLSDVVSDPDTNIRLFGKPEINGHRRLGVIVSVGEDIYQARDKARTAVATIEVTL